MSSWSLIDCWNFHFASGCILLASHKFRAHGNVVFFFFPLAQTTFSHRSCIILHVKWITDGENSSWVASRKCSWRQGKQVTVKQLRPNTCPGFADSSPGNWFQQNLGANKEQQSQPESEPLIDTSVRPDKCFVWATIKSLKLVLLAILPFVNFSCWHPGTKTMAQQFDGWNHLDWTSNSQT